MLNKKLKWILVSLFILILSLVGCKNTQKEDNGKPKVYTSFYTMYDFTSKIGGEKIEVYNMVPSGIEPHDWEPSAFDIVNIENAHMFVYNGVGMEHWVDGVLNSISNKELVIVEASIGINLLDGEDNHGDENFDAHVWTNPMNAKIEMQNIRDGLISIDPDNKEYYSINYEKYAKELDKLNEEFINALGDLPNKDIVVSHKAFSYMCDAYGLNQIAIDGLTPDSEPNPGRMAEIIDFITDNNIKVVFFEELASPKVANTISKATGAEVEVLNPLEGLSEEDLQAGEDYFSIMRKNLEALLKSLK